MIYQLMHKDKVCGELTEMSGVIQSYQDNGEGFSPFLGNCDFDKIKKWWTMRSVPASRHAMQEMLRNAGYENPGSYLAKNLAVSISDTYWIRPLGENLKYRDVKFYNPARILRDPDTMKIIGPVPIYDSGNSMFYNENRKTPYTRADILDREITSFYSREEKLLKKVKNRNIVREDLLPSRAEVRELYAESGIPEWKAAVIAENYNIKLQLLHEFRKGKTISVYNEKLQSS